MILRFAFILLAVIVVAAPASAQSAREIMGKVDAREDGDNMSARQEMILIDRNGAERVRELMTFTKDKGRDTLRLSIFMAPADVRETGFLTHDRHSGDADDDQWLYLPELKKTKRIASSDKSSAFMGTDFSYADMTRRVVDEWNYALLKEDDVRGHKVWLIEATPKNETVRDRYGYDKSVVFVRQDIFMIVRAVHWVREGRKLKYLDVKSIENVDGIWVATEIDMKTTKNRETEHRTVLRFSDVKFNQALDEAMFTIRGLEKGL